MSKLISRLLWFFALLRSVIGIKNAPSSQLSKGKRTQVPEVICLIFPQTEELRRANNEARRLFEKREEKAGSNLTNNALNWYREPPGRYCDWLKLLTDGGWFSVTSSAYHLNGIFGKPEFFDKGWAVSSAMNKSRGGNSHVNVTGDDRPKFWKEPRKGTGILLCRLGLNNSYP